MPTRYEMLRDKLDAKAEELTERHRTELRCKRACHGCCQSGLTVFPVEARTIRAFLVQTKAEESTLALEQEDPFRGSRCSFLDREGACSIYPVRPLICRSHGLPLQFRDAEESLQRDVCPLNFVGTSLETLPGEAVLNLDLINTLLTLINGEAIGEGAEQRVALKASAILASDHSR